jgi:hypothetical protein
MRNAATVEKNLRMDVFYAIGRVRGTPRGNRVNNLQLPYAGDLCNWS